MEAASSSSEIENIHQKIDRLEKLVERLIGVQAGHVRGAYISADTPSASQSAQPALYSQAHIVQPTRSVAWAKIASNCPDHLKDTLKEMRAEHMQQDRDHRRNRKREYAGEYVRVFVNGIHRFQAKANSNGRMTSRVERTEKFLQAMRIHTNRIHTMFPRGRKTFEFLVEVTYETSFRASMIEMNCAAIDSFNPDLPRNPHQATEAEKLEVKRISLEQYAREATRAREGNTHCTSVLPKQGN